MRLRARFTQNAHRAQWVVLGLALFMLAAYMGWGLNVEHRQILEREQERLATQARVVEDNLLRQLQAASSALSSVRADLPYLSSLNGHVLLLNRRLRSLSDAMPGVRTILVLDRHGKVIGSNRDELLERDFSNRDYFKLVAQGQDPKVLYVAAPFKTVLNVYSVNLLKVIIDNQGRFDGAISATLDPDYFNTLMESVRYAPDMWTALAHADGLMINHLPSRPELLGSDLAKPGTMFTRHKESGQKATSLRGLVKTTQEHSLMAQRTIESPALQMSKSLVLAVARAEDAVFAQWKRSLKLSLSTFLILTAASTLSLFQYQRRQRANNQFLLRQEEERKQNEEEIQTLAFFDPLTELPNRRMLTDRLKQALANTTRHNRKGALLFIDLDHFKTLNDTQGHFMGDLLLQQVAKRLSTCVREGDTVARLGGDEFVVMLENLSENEAEAALQAESVGEKILATLGKSYLLENHVHNSTPSVGITLFDASTEGVDEPLKRADVAMYQAKAAGRNTFRFFNPELQLAASRRMELGERLRHALERQEFVLYYQPQVMQSGWVSGVEVLLRWNDPDRGMVSPAEFIPVAEETGLILPLGHWVLKSACQQLARWAGQAATSQLTVAVNVSAKQLAQANFVTELLEVLEQTGANPALLKLEITESMLVHNIEEVIAKMVAIKALGVGFSIDDFGTGYSSLTYLKRLPLDQLKIDQGFVRDILDDPNDAAISNMVIALASSMKLSVIAEGVETMAQRDFLARQGCCVYQGYLFSKPVPVGVFEAWLQNLPKSEA